MQYIRCLEESLGVEARINFAGMAPGDVRDTWADISALTGLTGYSPKVNVADGISAFVEWYRDYYRVSD